jgi:hypothetical protein
LSELGLRLRKFVRENGRSVKQTSLVPKEGFRFEDNALQAIRSKLFNSGSVSLGSIEDVTLQIGLVTGSDSPFVLSMVHATSLLNENANYSEIIKPLVKGDMLRKDITILDIEEYIIFIPRGFTLERYKTNDKQAAELSFSQEFPRVYEHINRSREKLETRTITTIGDFFFETRDGVKRCLNNEYAFSKMIEIIKVCKIDVPDSVLLVTGLGVNAPKYIRDFLDIPLVSIIFNKLLMADSVVFNKLPNALRELPFPKSLLYKDTLSEADLITAYGLTEVEVNYLLNY